MLKENIVAQDAREQLSEFKKSFPPLEYGEILNFEGVDRFDVYNPTTPFLSDGKTVMACRVEQRENEVSKTMFFEQKGDKWTLIEDAPVFDLQDPFVAIVGDEIIIGGVYVIWDGDICVEYCTEFYRGTSIYNLKYLTSGPKNMKDVRIVELPDGKIGVFSRPQGQRMEKYSCIAKIGFTIVDKLEDINVDIIENAPNLEGHFRNDEWGGVNQIFVLKNGLLGVIGHKSWGEYDEKGVHILHYYSIAFALNYKTLEMTDIKVIASREFFPEGPYKYLRVKDVVFTSGIVRLGDNRAYLYGGLSDCQVGKILISDPFIEYESYKPLLAQRKEYILEPIFNRYLSRWQAHHVTNPSLVRPSFDDRVYLGYRAGGDCDHYVISENDVWSSSLGLSILDKKGIEVLYRFPLPIMTIVRNIPLPQAIEQYDEYLKNHKDDVVVLHDFRLYEFDGYIYVIYHDGSICKAFDAVKRMKNEIFKEKVEKSIQLSKKQFLEIKEEWSKMWDINEAWESCGSEGRLVFPSVNGSTDYKTDITFYKLKDEIQLMRRPLPDISVFATKDGLKGHRTEDGDSEFGVLEQCIRPGYYDNSHIGPNGMPSLAKIGDLDVYIDVCHGVHNGALANRTDFIWDMYYSPFFRVKDAKTGDMLYYSDNPILNHNDEEWSDYSRRGRWIKQTPHTYIVFVGGQTPMEADKTGLDDSFNFYCGIGDTAIARGEFTIRNLLPDDVITDILNRAEHRSINISPNKNTYALPNAISGWSWCIENNTEKRAISIKRSLNKDGMKLNADRVIYNRPGYFDADYMIFDGKSIKYDESLGWCLIYKGIRWNNNKTYAGFGMLILDRENLERVYYRSFTPIEDLSFEYEGYVLTDDLATPEKYLNDVEKYIPEQVSFEIKRSEELVKKGIHWRSHHTMWLERRAGI